VLSLTPGALVLFTALAVLMPPRSGSAAIAVLCEPPIFIGVVPLSSAYTACEAFGWEMGVGWSWREARAFYGLLAFFIGFAALFMLIPGISPFQVMFLSQVLNGLLLPIILVFVMLLSSDRRLLGPLVSGRFLLVVGWVITIALTLMSLTLVWTTIFPIG
jgi:Mn2+/Fe2+ NRAMP family transporter